MTLNLEIEDGNPYWASSSIWVVPGDDPAGPPGSPVAGRTNFVWARVQNRSERPAVSAQVDYFWSNPATGVYRSTSTRIGQSFVDLAPGEAADVLCVVPWTPAFVNDGHVCLVAQVVHPEAPLPVPLPEAFDPAVYAQIAQRNVQVLDLTEQAVALPIQVLAGDRRGPRSVVLSIERQPGALDPVLLQRVGVPSLPPSDGTAVEVGFMDPQAGPAAPLAPQISLILEAGAERPVLVRATRKRPFSGYEVAHVLEREGSRVVGGTTLVFTHS